MADPYLSATKECDLVMKGGMTSGIVYPPAVLTLARTYRFRSIGGTSAGAIAAAVTAAAEYGREAGGFGRLETVAAELRGGTFLHDLFQPSPEARPLMRTLEAVYAARKHRARRTAWQWIRFAEDVLRQEVAGPFRVGAQRGVGLALLVAVLIAAYAAVVLMLVSPPPVLWRALRTLVVLSIALAVPLSFAARPVGGFAGAVSALRRMLLVEVPANLYGICSGLKQPGTGSSPGLTEWLSDRLDLLAGIAAARPPLTFGDLQGRRIALRMITSNLAHQQPYELPFSTRKFIFKEEELSRLFPQRIVRHMVQTANPTQRLTLPAGYSFLPRAAALPVAFAMRLSLSFPLIISAVPLYTIKSASFRRRAPAGEPIVLGEDDLQQNWFSDGGIASNFPIHFFDAWLPTRPTFGIKLASLPPDAFEGAPERGELKPEYVSASPDQVLRAQRGEPPPREPSTRPVFLPRANAPQSPEWMPVEGLPAFLGAILGTALNYRDNTQSLLPSYRERIVQVRLSDEEGGLNLAMDAPTRERIMARGREAAEILLTQFDFRRHWWVRFLVLMGQLEKGLDSLEASLGEVDPQAILDDQADPTTSPRFPYRRDEAWVRAARERLADLRGLADAWSERAFFSQRTPQPEPVLRVTPRGA